jgi:hypothetical protein
LRWSARMDIYLRLLRDTMRSMMKSWSHDPRPKNCFEGDGMSREFAIPSEKILPKAP